LSKVIVITGAGSGLGRALARRLANDGDTVVLLGRTLEKLQTVVAEIGARASAIACDIRSPESVHAAFDAIAARFSQIDVLINNAATMEHAAFAEASDDHIINTLATNLTGPILCARAAIPFIRRGGLILNVSSGAAERNFPTLSLYATAKAGIERFSLALYEELQPQDIGVTFLRLGQMIERLDSWQLDPAAIALADAIAAQGMDPRKRPSSTFASVTNAFRALIDLPPDLRAASIALRPRAISDAG
jgi:NAD(P)-dependent dehydrogenase (short-subunit alcohol dehydrogenase family)